jgi:hypothetical protein
MLEGQLVVREDGSIWAMTPDAERVIRVLGLDDPEFREFRTLWIGIVQMAQEFAPDMLVQLMKYPDDLPDLASLRPPHNTRPEGLNASCRARRTRNELPDTY